MKTSEEKKKYKREWYLANKDKVKEYNLRNKENSKVNRDIKKNLSTITLELSMDF